MKPLEQLELSELVLGYFVKMRAILAGDQHIHTDGNIHWANDLELDDIAKEMLEKASNVARKTRPLTENELEILAARGA